MEITTCKVLNGIITIGSSVKVYHVELGYSIIGKVKKIMKLADAVYVQIMFPNGEWVSKSTNCIEVV